MPENRLRSLLAQGRTALGAWLMMSTPSAAEMMGGLGFDYICIDCQHGLLGYEEMRDVILALKGLPTTPIVRVPSNDASWIGKALDMGAEGVVVPLVNTPDEARAAVRSARFPPLGDRSFGSARAQLSLGRDPSVVNEQVLCFVMIETAQGTLNAEAIAAEPGVDGVYIGPADLALSLGGSPLREFPPEHQAAVERIRDACLAAGTVPGIHSLNGADARLRAHQGFRMVTCTSDVGMLASGGLHELNAARG